MIKEKQLSEIKPGETFVMKPEHFELDRMRCTLYEKKYQKRNEKGELEEVTTSQVRGNLITIKVDGIITRFLPSDTMVYVKEDDK